MINKTILLALTTLSLAVSTSVQSGNVRTSSDDSAKKGTIDRVVEAENLAYGDASKSVSTISGGGDIPLSTAEGTAMSRIQSRVTSDAANHFPKFSGFHHGVDFWTQSVTLVGGKADVTMVINLPKTTGNILYIGSDLSYSPGSDDVALCYSLSAMSGFTWLGGCNFYACYSSGLSLKDSPSTLVTVKMSLKSSPPTTSSSDILNGHAATPPKTGIVAIYVQE